MGLPAIPTRHQDSSAHRQRISEVVNGVTSFQFDDSRVRTAAEIAALVTPVNYAYLELTLERYGGGTAASAATNNAALTAAIAVATSKVGGVIQAMACGVYQFSGSFILPPYTTLQGQGYGTVFQYTGSGSFLTMNSGSSRVTLAEMQILGTSQTGTGLTLGDASGNAGFCKLLHVLFSGWNLALRMGGATWLTCEKCEFGNAAGTGITNNVGIDFNYFGGSNYSSALTFRDCVVSNNANAGVQATSVLVTMNSVNWLGFTNIQNNCQSATGNPQFYMGSVVGFTIDGLYVEYVIGGTPPDAIRSDNMNNGEIRSFFIATAANGIKDRGGGAMNQVEIFNGQMVGVTTDAIHCTSENDVVARNVATGGATVVLTGTGCSYLPLGSGLASWPKDKVVFAPALSFAGGGSITQTVAAATWSRLGNTVTFGFRINWTAIAAPAGNITVTGIPIAPSGPDITCTVWSSGVTIAAGYLQMTIASGATTGSLYNVQTTTALVQGAALAATGTVIVSGSYQV